jgi:serine/threonine protein kinase
MQAMAPVFPVLGQTLGPYRLLTGVGLGGLSAVFRGIDERSRRPVAVKVPIEGALAGDAPRQRLRREALVLQRLDHPSSPAFLDLGSQDGIDFLVLEYVAGRTLASRLREEGPLDEAAVLRLGLEIAAALGGAHRCGVIHCDVKPSNIALTPDGAVKLLDFGHARFVGETVQKDTGTVPYMAPERLLGRPQDERVDLWSLGALLYEAATGERPFRGGTATETAAAIREGCFAPPSCRRPELSDQFDRIVQRALESDPDRRYPSADQMSRDLRSGPSY